MQRISYFCKFCHKQIASIASMGKDNLIIEKIDQFIRKYYQNQLIKGFLYTATLSLSLFIVIIVLEHFGYFGTTLRMLLLLLFVVVLLLLLTFYIVIPLLRMNRIGRCLSYEEAARIIGRHFPEVKDKLLNLLQLQQNGKIVDNILLQAAIEQKTAQLRPVPFTNAVDFSGNHKYIKYAVVPAVLIIAVLCVAPSFITEPSRRLLHPTVYYEKPAPFSFVIENDTLTAVRHDNFLLRVRIEGEVIPVEAYVCLDGVSYRMQQEDKRHYTYLFKNVRENMLFCLVAGEVKSRNYSITVLPNPVVVGFSVLLSYPAYTGKRAERLENIGDIVVPEGTAVQWNFLTRSADTLYFLEEKTVSDSLVNYSTTALLPDKNGRATHSKKILQGMDYGLWVSNRQVVADDTLRYTLSTIRDEGPMIAVMEVSDSLVPERIYFKGRIKDDYGFERLQFVLTVSNAKDSTRNRLDTIELPLGIELSQEFYHSLNLMELQLQLGDKVTYYFKVWDNDAIHGSKVAVSQTFEVQIPTEGELDDLLQQNYDQIQDKATQSMNELKQLQQEIDDLLRNLVGKKDLSWQDKQQLQQLAEKQRKVRNELQKMQKQIQENNRLEEHYREQNEEIAEKQRELEKLMEKVLSEEMKAMMEEMGRLMEQLDRNKVQEQLQNMKVKQEELSKQLDQNIELMRRLELEKKVEEAVRKVDDMAQRQKHLAEESKENKGKENRQLQEKQTELNQEFKALQEELRQIQEDYKKLDDPEHFETNQQLQQSIEQHQQQAGDKLQRGKKQQAGEEMQQAGEKMQQLSEQLQQSQLQMEQQNIAEDSEQIRRLLKNLVQLSFNQEELMEEVQHVMMQDPKYQEIISAQNKVKTDFRNVNDTLLSIAKRQLAVASAIHKELAAVNSNIAKSLNDLLFYNQTFYGRSRNVPAATAMQYTMTSLNNLSLILAESLDKMQDQMRKNQQQQGQKCNKPNGKQKSKGSCSNPGNSSPSPKSMKEMQDALNKQMESLRQQLNKQGDKQGRAKIGEKQDLSEQFARMAAEQEQIRRMMEEYGREMKQNSPGNKKLAREIDEMMRQMEQTETDLVNRTITNQTMKRQQQIMTRLLEHEKASLKQRKEERRESTEAKDMFQPSQGDLEKYEQLQNTNLELFRVAPPSLSPYYKNKVNDYFYKFKM